MKGHIEQCHPYLTKFENYYKIDNRERAQIYELAGLYIIELEKIKNGYDDGSYRGEVSAKNLLPQYYGKEIPQEDMERIIQAQSLFAKRLLKKNLHLCDWNLIMNDLENFFNCGIPYYDTNFCPTLSIDFL